MVLKGFVMLKNLFFLMILLLWGGLAQAKAPTLLIVGDSLSAAYGMASAQSWVALLEQRLSQDEQAWQVVNASISGDTSSGGRARLPALLAMHEPRLVLLALGGNDGLRGLSLKQLRENLGFMIEQSQAANAKLILLGIKIPPNYGEVYTNAFAQVFEELAHVYELPFVPFFLDGVGGHAEMMQADGIHPNVKAQETILANVWVVLEKVLNTLE
jgi:acyl-CoA thioesterase I